MRAGKQAFTLIEMILMMVIMGIAFATLPMILRVSSESVGSVMDIRGIYHGAAKIQIIRGKPWDESNVDDYEKGGIYYAVNTQECTGGGVLCCDRDKNRSGHYPGPNRRMCENAAASVILGRDGGDYDDLDDFHNSIDGDIEGYALSVGVAYVGYSDGPSVALPVSGASGGTSNLKRITVEVRDATGVPMTTYRYYAANIGSSKPYIKKND